LHLFTNDASVDFCQRVKIAENQIVPFKCTAVPHISGIEVTSGEYGQACHKCYKTVNKRHSNHSADQKTQTPITSAEIKITADAVLSRNLFIIITSLSFDYLFTIIAIFYAELVFPLRG